MMNDTKTTAARVMTALSAAGLICAIWRGWGSEKRKCELEGEEETKGAEQEEVSLAWLGDAGG